MSPIALAVTFVSLPGLDRARRRGCDLVAELRDRGHVRDPPRRGHGEYRGVGGIVGEEDLERAREQGRISGSTFLEARILGLERQAGLSSQDRGIDDDELLAAESDVMRAGSAGEWSRQSDETQSERRGEQGGSHGSSGFGWSRLGYRGRGPDIAHDDALRKRKTNVRFYAAPGTETVSVSRPERSTVPGRASVKLLPRTISWPFTRTCSMPFASAKRRPAPVGRS